MDAISCAAKGAKDAFYVRLEMFAPAINMFVAIDIIIVLCQFDG